MESILTIQLKNRTGHFIRMMVLVSLCILNTLAYSQDKKVEHDVRDGETFATVARMYNVSPQALADYNNLDYYEGQLFSKILKIPPVQIAKPTKKDLEKPTEKLSTEQQPALNSTPVNTPRVVATSPDIKKSKTHTGNEQPIKIAENYSSSKQENATARSFHLPPAKQMMPVVIFVSLSIVVLIGAIAFYKSLQR